MAQTDAPCCKWWALADDSRSRPGGARVIGFAFGTASQNFRRHVRLLNEAVIAFADHRQLEPIDELRAQCLSRAHVRGRLAQGGGVRSQSNDAAENGADRADHDQRVEPYQPE